MHVLITGDNRGAIKKSVTADLKKVQSSTKMIPQAIGMKRKLITLSGEKLSSKSILQSIKNTSVGNDDIFLFYFSGHGLQSKKKSPWPAMLFSKKDERLDLQEVISAIKKKEPRLTIILCDACNRLESKAKSVQAPSQKKNHRINSREKAGLRKLFAKTKGTIIVCGAQPNSVSWSCKNGGMLTGMFIFELVREAERSSPSWERLLSETKKSCEHVQNPITKINLSKD